MPRGLIKPPFGTPIDRSHPLAQGLVASYLCNDGGGNILNDGLGGLYNATIAVPGNIAWAAGAHGPALSGSGSAANAITMANAVPLGTSGPWTWETYLKIPSTSNGYYHVYADNAGNGGSTVIITIHNNGGNNQLDVYAGSDHLSTTTLAVGGWYHLAVTTVGTTQLNYYANGMLTDTVTCSQTWSAAGPNILASASTGQQFTGLVSYQRFWNRSLSASEIRQLYTQPFVMYAQPKASISGTSAANATANPPGVAAAVSPGTISPQVQVSPTGNAGTGAAGSVNPQIQANPSGVACAGAAGIAAPRIQVSPSGVAAAGQPGTVTVTTLGSATASPVGVSASGRAGIITFAPVVQAGGGGDGWYDHELPKPKKEGIDRKKLDETKEFREELEEAYNELYGIRRQVPEAAAIVKPFASKPQKWLPPASTIDFKALAADLEAAKELLRLHQEQIEDEEDYFIMAA